MGGQPHPRMCCRFDMCALVLEVWFMYCNVDVSVVNRYTIACCRLFLIAVAALNVRRSIHGTAFAIYIYMFVSGVFFVLYSLILSISASLVVVNAITSSLEYSRVSLSER